VRLAVVGGDGIGPDVTAEAVRVLRAATDAEGIRVDTKDYQLGAERYLATGEVLPDSLLDELRGHDAAARAPHEADRTPTRGAERLGPLEAERLAQQRVVPHLGVRVERKVVGGQRGVAAKQHLEPRLQLGGDHRGSGAPDDAVMAEDEVGARILRPLEQIPVRRDARDHEAHVASPRHLEAVRSVVLEGPALQQVVEVGDDGIAVGRGAAARG